MHEQGLITPSTTWYARIKLYRTARGLTQQQMADAVGVEHRRFWGWEAGQSIPRPAHQLAVAKALGVEPEAIFGGSLQDFTGLTRKEKTEE